MGRRGGVRRLDWRSARGRCSSRVFAVVLAREGAMPTPTREMLIAWARGYVEHWNAGDKRAWVENWKRVAPGEFVMVDPVGTLA